MPPGAGGRWLLALRVERPPKRNGRGTEHQREWFDVRQFASPARSSSEVAHQYCLGCVSAAASGKADFARQSGQEGAQGSKEGGAQAGQGTEGSTALRKTPSKPRNSGGKGASRPARHCSEGVGDAAPEPPGIAHATEVDNGARKGRRANVAARTGGSPVTMIGAGGARRRGIGGLQGRSGDAVLRCDDPSELGPAQLSKL